MPRIPQVENHYSFVDNCDRCDDVIDDECIIVSWTRFDIDQITGEVTNSAPRNVTICPACYKLTLGFADK